MDTDSSGNPFINLDNVRLTFVAAHRRPRAKNWAGQNVIRINAYRGDGGGRALHQGAEIPIGDPVVALRFVEAL